MLSTGGAGAASAHADRRRDRSRAGQLRFAQGPPRVSATFNETLQTQFAAMTVVGPDGNLWSTGDPQVERRRRQRRRAAARPGGHLHGELPGDVGRRARGVGSWSFRLTVGGDRHTGPVGVAQRTAIGDGIPVWPFVVAAAVIVAAGALWAVRRQQVTRLRVVAGGAAGRGGRGSGGVVAGYPAELTERDAGAGCRRLLGGRHAGSGRGPDARRSSDTAAS